LSNTPRELTDAATIDGCSRWQTLWYILWPIAKPAVTTLVVLIFMWTWNEFLLALVLVQNEALRYLASGSGVLPGKVHGKHSLDGSWGNHRRLTDNPDLHPLPTLLHPGNARRRSERLITLTQKVTFPKNSSLTINSLYIPCTFFCHALVRSL